MVTIADHLFRNNLNSRLYSRPKNWSGVEWSGMECSEDDHVFNHRTV